MSLEPWQSFLDSLTQKAAEENILCKLKNKNEENVVIVCTADEKYRSKLLKWMDNYLENSSITKSTEDSVKYRALGNDKFKTRHDEHSLHLYSKSILIAPVNSEEYAVALGNRSAVLFEMKLYELCSRDIDIALESKAYPKILLHKILLRQARCLKYLHKYKECQNVLKTLRDHLENNATEIPQKKLDEINEEIDVIHTAVNTDKKGPLPSLHDLTKTSWEIPLPKGGLSPSFPSASSCVELKFSQKKGRHVVASVPLNQGDVIFVEKPYVSVVLPDQYLIHCHHCSKRMYAPIPCTNCCQALFCSHDCLKEASAKYHLYECGALPMMWSIGIAHLGLRTLLVTGSPEDVIKRAKEASSYFSANKRSFWNSDDPYSAVFGLVSHVESMFPEDSFQYAMTAILLTEYLRRKTNYFGASDSEETKKEICAIVLRHIAQLVCNAHALTKIDDDSESILEESEVIGESQQRIATAIYPAASMMNHSCDPNISNSFHHDTLIVKASRNIAAGEEVFNCYGPHRARMSTGDRQAALLAQYFFHCACTACEPTTPETDEAQERCNALCCATCKGPLLTAARGRQPAGAKEAAVPVSEDAGHDGVAGVGRGHSVHRMVCAECGSTQAISAQVEGSFRARYLFNQGLEASRAGDVNKALSVFLECRDIQQRCLYRTHGDLAATQDQIAKCYAVLGKYSDCIPCLWDVIAANEEQYGPDSVEVGHELRKLSDVMVHDIRSSSPKEQKEKRTEAKRVMERAQKIFSTQYGEWDSNWQELNAKLQELQLDSVQ